MCLGACDSNKDAMNLQGRGGNRGWSRKRRGRNDINTTLGHERGIKKGLPGKSLKTFKSGHNCERTS